MVCVCVYVFLSGCMVYFPLLGFCRPNNLDLEVCLHCCSLTGIFALGYACSCQPLLELFNSVKMFWDLISCLLIYSISLKTTTTKYNYCYLIDLSNTSMKDSSLSHQLIKRKSQEWFPNFDEKVIHNWANLQWFRL